MKITIDFSSIIDLRKLKELILYIAKHSEKDPCFGAVKLNKILYYSDFRTYRDLGKPITDAHYQHLEEGPAPKEMLAALKELEAEGAIEYEERPYFTRRQKRVVARRQPNLVALDKDGIKIVDEVTKYLWPYNATEVKELSHKEWGWKLTDMGEEIPYRTTWLSSEPLTQEQIENGLRLSEIECA